MAKYCANCGTEIRDDATKCSKCGKSFGVATEKKETNALAIVGIILSFLVPLLGLIFSIIGLKKSKELNNGKDLSVVGIVISSIFMFIRFIAIIFVLIFTISVASNTDKIESNINDAMKKIPDVIERYDQSDMFD